MNQKETVLEIQKGLNRLGYSLDEDGIIGRLTLSAIDANIQRQLSQKEDAAAEDDAGRFTLAWGARVSPAFRRRVFQICDRFGWSGDMASWLMACIAFETGESFDPAQRNLAGSGATGLIQFMPTTAAGLGTTTAALAAMTAVRQLDYVERYFEPYADQIASLSDMYMAILMPRYVGEPDGAALFTGGIAYRQNAGLDTNRDGVVTKGEAARFARDALARGQKPENLWTEKKEDAPCA